MKPKVLAVIGTRPEVIKMAPVIAKLKDDKEMQLRVLSTAQHRQMLDQMLKLFQIAPDIDLDIMKNKQTLAELTSKLSLSLDRILAEENPRLVLAQGDTTTAFLVSLACFYRKIPFGHVEAGLRTLNPHDPFPEEMNRSLISRIATLNFAPTKGAVDHLLREGTDSKSIVLSGNTVIDSLKYILAQKPTIPIAIETGKRVLLVTAHRRENWGEKMASICRAVKKLADFNQDLQIVFPVHLNPHVSETIRGLLSGHPRILLTEPLPYDAFVALMQRAYLILSDSGGVQEEAPTLGTPVIVLRENTERPEAIDIGASMLAGTHADSIFNTVQDLLNDPLKRQKMIVNSSPFGDGMASERILKTVKGFLC